jgi:hypothetical protein
MTPCGSFAGGALQRAPQHNQLRCPSILIAHQVCRLQQLAEFGCRVVRGDAPGAVTQEVLTVLEADTGGPQATTEGVLEIVDPNVRQPSSRARSFPPRVQHALHGLPFVDEHVRCMLAVSAVDDRVRNPIEDHEPFVAVLYPRSRNYEDRGC